jgi:PilZ domain
MRNDISHRATIETWIARAERRGVHLQGRAHRVDGSSVSVALCDISYDGCCLIADRPLEAGEPLILEVTDLGKVEAEVRWADGRRVGVLFCPDRGVPVSTKFRGVRHRK